MLQHQIAKRLKNVFQLVQVRVLALLNVFHKRRRPDIWENVCYMAGNYI